MKRVRYLLITIVVAALLVIALPAVLGGPGDNDEIFFNENSSTENPNTTFVAPTDGEMMAVSSYNIKNRDLSQQVKESTIIVKGKVKKILGTVVTEDLVVPLKVEQAIRVHTDVLFEVDEYLGPNSLPFKNLVLRRMGGKIEGFTHIVKQENLTVGEELIIFRLSRPDYVTQIPEGYSLEQYFVFNPASKFINIGGDQYRASYRDQIYSIGQIRKASLKANPDH